MAKIEQFRKMLEENANEFQGVVAILHKFEELFPKNVANHITTSIQPDDMDSTNRPWDTKWGNRETECSAIWLLRLAQKNKSWRNISKQECDNIANEDFWFNKLIRTDDIIKNDDDTYSFTDGFILEMYKHCKKK